jgi:alpha-1,3-rhamnosyl/mannosyltransferase
MPECHPPERVSYMRKEVALSLKRASMLITDAEYTRHEVARYFGWPLTHVRAAQLASSGTFAPRPPEVLAPVLERYGLAACGYTLYAGTIEPRKNLVRLIDAYSRLPAALRARFPLVLAGYKGWNNDAIMAALAKAERQGWARYLGYVPEADLPVLFAGARIFAFPSLYEGFGLPVLEAMSSGVPVICSTSSTLPEVGGAAAASCAPEDVEGLSALLHRGLEDAAWREQAIDAGFGQAAKFSWRRCAEETAAIYRQALDGGRP